MRHEDRRPIPSWACLVAGLTAVLLLSGAVVVPFIPDLPDRVRELLAAAHASGPVGWGVTFAVQVLVALCGIIPASIVGIASGAIFGLWAGFGLAAAGTVTGAACAFVLTRSLFRPLVLHLLRDRPRLGQLDEAITRDGWRFACLQRLSPIMPVAVTSYALALTSISARDYLIGALASLPALFGYVLTGTLVDAGVDAVGHGVHPLRWAMLGIGLVATLGLTLRMGRLAVRAGLGSAVTGGVPPA
jgi:uncharacterized membrane protein YdjX (TVP38/TMEM64 family)